MSLYDDHDVTEDQNDILLAPSVWRYMISPTLSHVAEKVHEAATGPDKDKYALIHSFFKMVCHTGHNEF